MNPKIRCRNYLDVEDDADDVMQHSLVHVVMQTQVRLMQSLLKHNNSLHGTWTLPFQFPALSHSATESAR